MGAKIKATIDEIHFEKGDELKIRYAHWNKESNNGEGGYELGSIVIFQGEDNIMIVSKRVNNSTVKVAFKEVFKDHISQL